MKVHVKVTGTPYNGYRLHAVDSRAGLYGFYPMLGVTLPRYRVAQDIANAINADIHRINVTAEKRSVENGTYRPKQLPVDCRDAQRLIELLRGGLTLMPSNGDNVEWIDAAKKLIEELQGE